MTQPNDAHPDAATQAAPTDESATRFGVRLRLLRTRLELSTEGLARHLGVSAKTVYRWQELDQVRPSAVWAVERAFPEVNADWLKRGVGPVFSPAPAEQSPEPVPGEPGGLEERGRSVCLSLEGPSGRVLARVDMVLMGSSQPLQVPLSMSEPS